MVPAGYRIVLTNTHKMLIKRLMSTDINESSTFAKASRPLPSSSQKFPEAPDPLSCCGSGCANCVWMKYADEVNEYLSDKEHNSKSHKFLDKYKAIKDEMDKNVEDVNLRAYLLMEIKAKLSKK